MTKRRGRIQHNILLSKGASHLGVNNYWSKNDYRQTDMHTGKRDGENKKIPFTSLLNRILQPYSVWNWGF